MGRLPDKLLSITWKAFAWIAGIVFSGMAVTTYVGAWMCLCAAMYGDKDALAISLFALVVIGTGSAGIAIAIRYYWKSRQP